jgi:glycosyltransferase involved in cell wall biosynthesis
MFLTSHSALGGAQFLWSNIAEGFRERGHEVQLVALYPFSDPRRESTPDHPWEYILASRPKSLPKQVELLRQLVARVRNTRPDVIVTALPAANVLAPLAAKLARTGSKVVITHHSPAETHSRLLNYIDGYTGSLSNVKWIVSVSGAVSRSLDNKPKQYLPKRKVIYNALPPEIEQLLTDLNEQHSPRAARGRKVVATGRLAKQKNYPLLIRSAAHLPDVTFDIVGDGPDADALTQLAEDLNVTERLNFMGHQQRVDALRILAAGDIFAQVSLFEGHSLALVEAAKLGMPLIVSDSPVQIESVTANDGTRCGIVVGMQDDRDLAKQISMLLSDPSQYQFWSERSRKLGEEATFHGVIDAYQELMV